MKAKDFNKLSTGDRVIIDLPDALRQAPHNIIALQGRIVVTFRAQIAPAQAKTKTEPADTPGEACCEPIDYYRISETETGRFTPKQIDIIRGCVASLASDNVKPYSWEYHDNSFYTATTSLDKKAIADPVQFIKNEAGHSWEKVKDFYAKFKKWDQAGGRDAPPADALSHPDGGMQALLDYRSYLAEKLIAETGPAAREDAIQRRKAAVQKNPSYRQTDFSQFFQATKAPGGDAPGSKEPTSDIDLNTFNDGTEFLVAAFNDSFCQQFDDFEPGFVFDVNVYGKDFLPRFGDNFALEEAEKTAEAAAKANPELANKPERRFVLPIRDYVFTAREMEYKDAASQMAAALLKLRRYMAHSTFLEAQNEDVLLHQAQEWDAFVALLDEIQAGDLVAGVQQKFEENQQALAGIVKFVKSRKTPTSQSARDLAASLLQKPKPGTFATLGHDDDAFLMSAENRIYEARLREVAERRTIFDVAKAFAAQKGADGAAARPTIDQAYLELRTKLSDSLFFANEAYVTSGAVTQVVGGKQNLSRGVTTENQDKEAKSNIAYTAHELMHSIVDNLADIYKETKRYYRHHPLDTTKSNPEAEQFGGAILKSSKYIHRMFNAIKHLYLLIGIVEAYQLPVALARDPLWDVAQQRFPQEDFASLSRFLVFRKIGFGLEALKKIELQWDDPGSVDVLKNLLATKFSLAGDGIVGPFGKPAEVKADFIVRSLEDIVARAKHARSSTNQIAASAVYKFFTECLTTAPAADTIYFQKMENVRAALTQLVVHVMADYHRIFSNDRAQDELVGKAMAKAERPYPRLYEPPTTGSGATQ